MIFVFLNIALISVIFNLLSKSKADVEDIKASATTQSIFLFLLSLGLLDYVNPYSQLPFYLPYSVDFFIFNFKYIVGFDGLSVAFILLTTFIIPITIGASWSAINLRVKYFMLLLFVLEFFLINTFAVLDVFFFYVLFESTLIPTFLLISVWGANIERLTAAFQFFLYTLFGSIFMLLAILVIFINTGTTDYFLLRSMSFNEDMQLILWIAFFLAFAVKVPMVPVHIWLPKAHVEAPTAGSILLAAILLKLGFYGLIRFSLVFFPYACDYFKPLVCTLCILAIIYTSFTTIRQIDLKRIIAYSSVAHMNFGLLGLFSDTLQGVQGSILLMVGHGFISAGLFLCIGVLYDRYHTRIITYYGGLADTMPIFTVLFFFFLLANVAFPGGINFVAEFLILAGLIKQNLILTLLAGTSMILGSVYSFWLFNRIAFVPSQYPHVLKYRDISDHEMLVIMPLVVCTILFGLLPNIILDATHFSAFQVLTNIK